MQAHRKSSVNFLKLGKGLKFPDKDIGKIKTAKEFRIYLISNVPYLKFSSLHSLIITRLPNLVYPVNPYSESVPLLSDL